MGEIGDVVAVVADALKIAQDVDKVHTFLGVALTPVQAVDVWLILHHFYLLLPIGKFYSC